MWTLGQRIKELRKEANLTQQELSEGIVTRAYISQIEKGLVQPSYETLKLLAARLRCQVEDLFVEPENKILHLSESKRKIKMAEAFIESGSMDQAAKVIHSLANSKGEQILTGPAKGVYLWIKGKLKEHAHKWEAAAEYFSQSKELLANSSNTREFIRSIDSLGYAYLQLNRNPEAITTLNEGLFCLARESLGGILQISLYVNIGIAHERMGETHSAIRLLLQAKELNESAQLLYRHGQILHTLGTCYRGIGQLQDAETCFRMALSFFEMMADRENCAETKTSLGRLYRELSQFDLSIRHLQEALHQYQQLHHPPGIFMAYEELAHAHMESQRFQEAEQLCQDLISLDLADGKHRVLAHRLLGDAARLQGNDAAALRHYELSLHCLEDLSLLASEHRQICTRLADVYYERGNYQEAAHYYRLACGNPDRPADQQKTVKP